jgi:hypothetical protein
MRVLLDINVILDAMLPRLRRGLFLTESGFRCFVDELDVIVAEGPNDGLRTG